MVVLVIAAPLLVTNVIGDVCVLPAQILRLGHLIVCSFDKVTAHTAAHLGKDFVSRFGTTRSSSELVR